MNYDTIKILPANISSKISDIPHSTIFTNISPRAREIKKKINKVTPSNQKASVQLKKTKKELTVWKDMFANDTLNTHLIYKTYKELI